MVAQVASILLLLAACESGKPPPGSPFAGSGSSAAPTAAPVASPPMVAPPAAPVASADPGFGDVSFKTYASGRTHIVFLNDAKASVTWGNMTGRAVAGTYVKTGNEIAMTWDPAADNYGSFSEKFRQLGPCSMARYERIDKKRALHDDPMIYQQIKPRCDTVRLSK